MLSGAQICESYEQFGQELDVVVNAHIQPTAVTQVNSLRGPQLLFGGTCQN